MGKIYNFLKIVLDKGLSLFNMFLKEVFTSSAKKILSCLQNIAIDVVMELSKTNLSNDKKRKEAFKKIKRYAIEEGIKVKDSDIQLLIELAVKKLKNSEKI